MNEQSHINIGGVTTHTKIMNTKQVHMKKHYLFSHKPYYTKDDDHIMNLLHPVIKHATH